ncbi:MAG: histidine kinase [Rhizobium sp.]|nr:histidine kinase [Rhizobium sp.]
MMNFQRIEDAQTLAQAIVNTIPEPFIVLDDQFCVLAASVSFYKTFKVDQENTRGRLLFSLGDGQWDIPALRLLLETIIPEHAAMDGFEVEHDFPGVGRRVMLLNARQVVYDDSAKTTILLAFMDVTARRDIEKEKERLLERSEELLQQKEELLHQKDVLLREMQHRVANSLQIISSILQLKAQAVSSEETRQHLRDARQRVMSVAEVQRHLHVSQGIDLIDVGSYLSTLCDSLATSMIGEGQLIAVNVTADEGMIGSDKAVSLGLIVTELVINAIKHAFPAARTDAAIHVTYEIDGGGWRLSVSDNGVGKSTANAAGHHTGLGSAIVAALVKQLDAATEIRNDSDGMRVSITRSTLNSQLPEAA